MYTRVNHILRIFFSFNIARNPKLAIHILMSTVDILLDLYDRTTLVNKLLSTQYLSDMFVEDIKMPAGNQRHYPSHL